MRQFYETYRAQPKLSTLSRELSWSHNMLIISRSKRPEEREFYSLTRSLSPALIAEYQTALPNKQLLQRKLHEFYQLALPAIEAPKGKPRKSRRS